MNHAIIVAGGVGSRMNLDIPKQFYEIDGTPVFLHSVKKFAAHPQINSITIVLSDEWTPYVKQQLRKEKLDIKILIAQAGRSRQHSVYNGLTALRSIASDDDLVFIHDAVRPLFPVSIIDDCIDACSAFDSALPVISVKDATYQSYDGETLSRILPRQELFSGQSPECFIYGKYLKAHSSFTDDEIGGIRGGAELAFRAGLSVKLVPGSEANFKITTIEDLRAFEWSLSNHVQP